MLLLHGEEHLERFRSETACAVYQLPWLSPRDAMNYSGELTELVPLFEVFIPSTAPVVRRINSQESSQLLSCVVTIRRPDICEKPCCNLLQPRLGRSSCSAS